MKRIRNPQTEIEREYERLRRRIEREPICKPGPGQSIGRCMWSRTGWAVWNDNGSCTCRPAKHPALSGEHRDV